MCIWSIRRRRCILQGKTSVVEHLDNPTYVYVDTPSGQMIVEAEGGRQIAPGTAVGLRLDAGHVHLFDAAGIALPALAD